MGLYHFLYSVMVHGLFTFKGTQRPGKPQQRDTSFEHIRLTIAAARNVLSILRGHTDCRSRVILVFPQKSRTRFTYLKHSVHVACLRFAISSDVNGRSHIVFGSQTSILLD